MVDARAALSQVSTVWRSWPMSTVPVQGWRCMSFRRRPHAPPRSHSLEIRRTGGIPPALEDPGGVDANHAITLVEIYSVAHELWTSFAKAASMSRLVLAFRTLISCPTLRAAV